MVVLVIQLKLDIRLVTCKSAEHRGQKYDIKVKGLDIYIPPLTGKPRPAAVYN